MAKFIGAQADIGIALEASRGVAESSASYWLPKQSLSIDDKTENIIDENSLGIIEDSPNSHIENTFTEGEIEGKVTVESMGLLLLATLGDVSTAGPTDSAYTHTLTVDQSVQHPSLSVFYNDQMQDYVHALGMITSLKISAELGSFVTYTAGIRSKKGATTSNSPSYDSTPTAFLPQHMQFKYASTQSGLDGASAVNIRMASLSIEKNVEDDRALGSAEPVDIINKRFAVTGELELVFSDQSLKTAFLADTEKAMRIKMTNTSVTIGSSTNPSVQFDLHRCKIQELSRNIGNDDLSTITIAFKAFYKPADTALITAKVVNDVASY